MDDGALWERVVEGNKEAFDQLYYQYSPPVSSLPKEQKNADWDHDHCEFCSGKFMVEGLLDVFSCQLLYRRYHLICEQCFQHF
jgi:hypothetical protein